MGNGFCSNLRIHRDWQSQTFNLKFRFVWLRKQVGQKVSSFRSDIARKFMIVFGLTEQEEAIIESSLIEEENSVFRIREA